MLQHNFNYYQPKIQFVQTYLFDPTPIMPLCFNCDGKGGFEYQYADNYEAETCECCNGTGFQQQEVSELVLWPELEAV